MFAPTWLILVVAAATVCAHVALASAGLLGAAGGLFAAGAVLSLVFSVSVRLASADFTERSARLVAARVPDGGRCGGLWRASNWSRSRTSRRVRGPRARLRMGGRARSHLLHRTAGHLPSGRGVVGPALPEMPPKWTSSSLRRICSLDRTRDRLSLGRSPATLPSSCPRWVVRSCKAASSQSPRGPSGRPVSSSSIRAAAGRPRPGSRHYGPGLDVFHLRADQTGISAATNRGLSGSTQRMRRSHTTTAGCGERTSRQPAGNGMS